MCAALTGEKPLRFWQKRGDQGDGEEGSAAPGRKFFKFSPVADCEQDTWRELAATADSRGQIVRALFPAEVAGGSLLYASPAVSVPIPHSGGDGEPTPPCGQSPHPTAEGLLFLAAVKRGPAFDIFLAWPGGKFALFEGEERFERYCLWPWGQRALLVDVYVARFWDVRVVAGRAGCEILETQGPAFESGCASVSEVSAPEILRPSWTVPDPTRPGTAVGIGMAAGGTLCLWRFGDELEPLFSSAWAAEDRYAQFVRQKMLELASNYSKCQEARSPAAAALGESRVEPNGEDFGEVERLFSSPTLRERAEDELRWVDVRNELCRTIGEISIGHTADFGHLAVGPSGKIFVSCRSGFAVYGSDLRRLSTYSLKGAVSGFSSIGFASSIAAGAGEEIRVYAQIVCSRGHLAEARLGVRHFEVTEEVAEPPEKSATAENSLDPLLRWIAKNSPAQRDEDAPSA